jgi:hypothetical protein
MHPRLPVILLSALALAAPGVSYAKDKGKNKGHQEHNGGDRGRGGDRDDDDRDGGDRRQRDDEGGNKMTICHIPPGNRSARHTISVGESAWQAHQAHGDHRGACGAGGGGNHDSRFDGLDRNRNGVISADEWLADVGTFRRLDTNGDGVLSPREFSRY